MLTLDGEQLERQRRITLARAEQQRQRDLMRADVLAKELTVATDGGICTTSLEEQLGTPMSTNEVLRRIKLMNPDLIYEVSIRYPDRIGIYVEEKREGVIALDKALTKRMVVAAQLGMMPERSVRHVKKTRVPEMDSAGWRTVEEFAGETRGWRTVLMRLLQEGLIRAAQIDKYFPANWNSRNWQRLTT